MNPKILSAIVAALAMIMAYNAYTSIKHECVNGTNDGLAAPCEPKSSKP